MLTRVGAGVTVAYGYDTDGRMTTTTVAGTQVTTNTYDAAGRLTSITKPDGSVETRTHDSTTTDLLSIVAVKSGTTVASSTYTYDNLGRKLTDTGIGYASSYAYDSAGQLTTENRTGSNASTSSYTYDNAGNRLTKVLNSVTESYTYDDANKLLTAGGKTYSYDNAGNVTGVSWSGGSQTLTWDGESRLKSATPSGGSATNYTYNGIGQRVAKSGAVSATYLLGDDAIDAEVISDGSATYAHGVAGLVSENRGGTTKLYHSDALGSVRALTNTSGTVTDSASRDAFGMVIASSGSTPTPFGFAGGFGYHGDSETGLMRLGHRMYDSATGRFISRDPIEYGYNWYSYCHGDSVNLVDPDGLEEAPPGGNQGGQNSNEGDKKPDDAKKPGPEEGKKPKKEEKHDQFSVGLGVTQTNGKPMQDQFSFSVKPGNGQYPTTVIVVKPSTGVSGSLYYPFTPGSPLHVGIGNLGTNKPGGLIGVNIGNVQGQIIYTPGQPLSAKLTFTVSTSDIKW